MTEQGIYAFFRPFGDFINHIEVFVCGKTQDIPGKNTPSASWLRFKFPFKQDSFIKNQYVTQNGGVRIGKLLELLDFLGVSVAYKYAKEQIGSKNVIMV